MRGVIDEVRGVGDYLDVTESVRVRRTPSYFEFEAFEGVIPQWGTTPVYTVVYMAPRDELSWWAFASLGSLYTQLFDIALKEKAAVRDALLETAMETWPLFAEGLVNGLQGINHPAAIAVWEDPDLASPTWVVSTVLGNRPPSAGVIDDASSEAMARIIRIGIAMVIEYRSRQLPQGTVGWRSFRNSVRNDVGAQARFVRDNFGSIVDVLRL